MVFDQLLRCIDPVVGSAVVVFLVIDLHSAPLEMKFKTLFLILMTYFD